MPQALKKSPVALIPNLEEAAAEYMRLKAQSAELDAAMKRLRNVLEVAVGAAPEKKAVIAGFKFALVEVERDNFNLKKALEKLDGRVLRPFITTSRYTQLREIK
jgi:hypothetical protein